MIRRGYTLVELLVAMALTGIVTAMVAQWVVHQAKAGARSERRIDAAEAVALFRDALFQDLHRGRLRSFARERLVVARAGADGESDSIVWELRDGGIVRAADGIVSRPLAALRNLSVSWEPASLPSSGETFGSAWWRLDRDQSGAIVADEIDSVGSVLVRVQGDVPLPAGLPPERESLTVAVPAVGL